MTKRKEYIWYATVAIVALFGASGSPFALLLLLPALLIGLWAFDVK